MLMADFVPHLLPLSLFQGRGVCSSCSWYMSKQTSPPINKLPSDKRNKPWTDRKACRLPVLYAMWRTPKQNLHSRFPATECFEMGKDGRLWGREAKYLLNSKTRDLCGNGKFAVLGVLVKTYNKIVVLSVIIFTYAGDSLPSLPRLVMARM